MTFSENPHGLGFASPFSGEWDPPFAVYDETGTVINLHAGRQVRSCNRPPRRRSRRSPHFPPQPYRGALGLNLRAQTVKSPGLQTVTSEAGVARVALVADRLASGYRRRESCASTWQNSDPTFLEVMHRNFCFTSIDDPSAFHNRDIIGADKVMLESHYPHADSILPDTQSVFAAKLAQPAR